MKSERVLSHFGGKNNFSSVCMCGLHSNQDLPTRAKMSQEIFTLKQFYTRKVSPHVPGKQSCGRAIRSMSFGTVTSSVSGAFCSPLRLLTFSILGLSFFFRKDRRLLLFKLLPALITWTSSLLINGGTNTERTSGSRGGRLLSFLWVPYRKKNKQNKHWVDAYPMCFF